MDPNRYSPPCFGAAGRVVVTTSRPAEQFGFGRFRGGRFAVDGVGKVARLLSFNQEAALTELCDDR